MAGAAPFGEDLTVVVVGGEERQPVSNPLEPIQRTCGEARTPAPYDEEELCTLVVKVLGRMAGDDTECLAGEEPSDVSRAPIVWVCGLTHSLSVSCDCLLRDHASSRAVHFLLLLGYPCICPSEMKIRLTLYPTRGFRRALSPRRVPSARSIVWG